MRRSVSRSKSRGQGIVEFALVVPIFLALTFGIIELGWLVYNNHTVSNATREGARYAMVNGSRGAEISGSVADADSVRPIVEERAGHLSSNIDAVYVGFHCSNGGSDCTPEEPGSLVTVETTYTYQPVVGAIVGVGSFQLTSESTVIVQY